MHKLAVTLEDFDFDPSIFEPIQSSNETIDNFISNEGGTMPATATMVTGSPGAGKTTLLAEWISDYLQNGKDVLYVSAEMSEIDFASYSHRFPHWSKLPIFFPNFERSIWADLESLFDYGFDVVVIDSFKEIKDMISDQKGWTKSKTEIELINLMKSSMLANNEKQKHTAFYVIQQVLKSGDFAGSKRLEHLMTANLKMVVEDNERYLIYEKNRRGDAHKKLYYTIHEDRVSYDADRRQLEEDSMGFVEKEKERQKRDRQAFDSVEDLLQDQQTHDEVQMPEQTPDETVDPEVVRSHLESNDGNVSAVLRIMKERGEAPESFSRYYLQKVIDKHGLDPEDEGIPYDVDVEAVADLLDHADGNVSRTLSLLKEAGEAPEDFSRYYLQKVIDRHGLS
jgi:primosomal protein N'